MMKITWTAILFSGTVLLPKSIRGNEDDQCSMYLAESSIPNAGYGMYTTKSISFGEYVSQDMSIPLVDVMWHLGENAEYIRWTHDDYVWSGDFENEYTCGEEVSINAFPIGALTNYHTFNYNVKPTKHSYDDSLLSRDDPGAGAYSYYERIFTANRDIAAGEEIFSSYGESWLEDHNYGYVPRHKDYRKAYRIAKEMNKAGKEWDAAYIKSLAKIISWYDKRTASLIPTSSADLSSATIESISWTNVTNRTVSWIRENGQCLDHIYGAKSSLPHAGRGAFAKRKLSKGEVVIPIPLLHIMNKTNFTLYGYDMEDGVKVRNEEEVVGNQLLINYCFTHPESYLLLCPSTHGALINHSQKPNAEYRWSKYVKKTEEWLKMSMDELDERRDQGLTLEIVATRGIEHDEEIFIDYGEDWQKAWDNHVQNFKPETTAETFKSAYQMNEEQHEVRTVDELIENPYPANIMTVCVHSEDELDEGKLPYLSDHDADNNTLKSILEIEREYNPSYTLDDLMEKYFFHFAPPEGAPEYWPCKVYMRVEGDSGHDEEEGEEEKEEEETGGKETTYVVRIFQTPVHTKAKWAEEGYCFVNDVPRDAIRFVNRPYKSHMYIDGVFRHPIHIRDDLFPQQWRNLKD